MPQEFRKEQAQIKAKKELNILKFFTHNYFFAAP